MMLTDILIHPGSFREEDKLYVSKGPSVFEDFETDYIKTRNQEKRILSIDAIRKLPTVPKSHPYFNEWQVRKFSSRKLITFQRNRNNSVILELGCGNGWLSGNLARSLDAMVVGVDVQHTELKQAAQAFGEQRNLYFICADILDNIFREQSIDTIVLAASVQYFRDFDKLISKLLSLNKGYW